MFPFQQRDELVFTTTSTASPRDKILDDLIADHAFVVQSNIIDFSTTTTTTTTSKQLGQAKRFGRFRQARTEGTYEHHRNNDNNNNNIRRVLHRDIERKRREEMSKLHLSLRSILPPEMIKGKRSMCDHVGEAVEYINYMQKKIQELRIRRDKLNKSCDLSAANVERSYYSTDSLPNRVVVNPVHEGLEILISGSSELGVSRVMVVLLERGIDVFSCISTKTNGMFLHKIQAEVRDATSLDLSVLQERLTNAIN